MRRGRWAAALLAVALLAGLCGAGNLLSRVTGPALDSRTSAAGGAAGPAGAAGGDPAAGPPGGGKVAAEAGTDAPDPAAGGQPAARVPPPDTVHLAAHRIAVTQPVTGPGRPPLPMTGTGPYGTLRTTGAPYVALTFDDGPDPRWTPRVLELLRKHRVRATFCVVGQLARAYPELVRRIAADGHTLCNHSWSHDVGLGSRSRAQIRANLERTTAAIRAVVPGARVSYYRQPGGAWTRRVVAVAAELGMSSLHWAVDPQDWNQPGAGAIADVVTTDTGEGEIVLLHDGGGQRRGTVRALRRILPELAGRLRVDALPPGVDPPRHHGRELPLKPGQI